ncbi:peptidoglycan-associated lipoprotein Pal [Segnochrobactraceae bacterium EtOH-i3]
MLGTLSLSRTARFAAVILATLTLAACASKQDGAGTGVGAATPGSTQDFIVNVGDRVFFSVDESGLSSEARATLDRQAQWLNRYPRYGILIEGNADERGTREYNLALGARRAQSVRDYLVSRGVSAQRIRTISYGKERPVAVCDDESCWSQNRRAVTVLQGAGS